jgi:hypothetical protein
MNVKLSLIFNLRSTFRVSLSRANIFGSFISNSPWAHALLHDLNSNPFLFIFQKKKKIQARFFSFSFSFSVQNLLVRHDDIPFEYFHWFLVRATITFRFVSESIFIILYIFEVVIPVGPENVHVVNFLCAIGFIWDCYAD